MAVIRNVIAGRKSPDCPVGLANPTSREAAILGVRWSRERAVNGNDDRTTQRQRWLTASQQVTAALLSGGDFAGTLQLINVVRHAAATAVSVEAKVDRNGRR